MEIQQHLIPTKKTLLGYSDGQQFSAYLNNRPFEIYEKDYQSRFDNPDFNYLVGCSTRTECESSNINNAQHIIPVGLIVEHNELFKIYHKHYKCTPRPSLYHKIIYVTDKPNIYSPCPPAGDGSEIITQLPHCFYLHVDNYEKWRSYQRNECGKYHIVNMTNQTLNTTLYTEIYERYWLPQTYDKITYNLLSGKMRWHDLFERTLYWHPFSFELIEWMELSQGMHQWKTFINEKYDDNNRPLHTPWKRYINLLNPIKTVIGSIIEWDIPSKVKTYVQPQKERSCEPLLQEQITKHWPEFVNNLKQPQTNDSEVLQSLHNYATLCQADYKLPRHIVEWAFEIMTTYVDHSKDGLLTELEICEQRDMSKNPGIPFINFGLSTVGESRATCPQYWFGFIDNYIKEITPTIDAVFPKRQPVKKNKLTRTIFGCDTVEAHVLMMYFFQMYKSFANYQVNPSGLGQGFKHGEGTAYFQHISKFKYHKCSDITGLDYSTMTQFMLLFVSYLHKCNNSVPKENALFFFTNLTNNFLYGTAVHNRTAIQRTGKVPSGKFLTGYVNTWIGILLKTVTFIVAYNTIGNDNTHFTVTGDDDQENSDISFEDRIPIIKAITERVFNLTLKFQSVTDSISDKDNPQTYLGYHWDAEGNTLNDVDKAIGMLYLSPKPYTELDKMNLIRKLYSYCMESANTVHCEKFISILQFFCEHYNIKSFTYSDTTYQAEIANYLDIKVDNLKKLFNDKIDDTVTYKFSNENYWKAFYAKPLVKIEKKYIPCERNYHTSDVIYGQPDILDYVFYKISN